MKTNRIGKEKLFNLSDYNGPLESVFSTENPEIFLYAFWKNRINDGNLWEIFTINKDKLIKYLRKEIYFITLISDYKTFKQVTITNLNNSLNFAFSDEMPMDYKSFGSWFYDEDLLLSSDDDKLIADWLSKNT